MTQPTVRYQNLLMDSARWEEISLREGDIIISTPPKSGTTWTQMICALLIFQTPELPRPLDSLSPWVDFKIRSRAVLRAEAANQTHRRFFKTHTPLDGLPFDPGVTYLCVGRDPRDAAISWDNHMSNVDGDALMAMYQEATAGEPGDAAVPLDELPPEPPAPLPTLTERFQLWLDDPEPVTGLAWFIHHASSFWRARHMSNVVLLHYDDLQADLAGQMRRLAERLGIEVAADRWDDLVAAATFDWMSSRAETFTPYQQIWLDPRRFFRRGSSGQWREALSPTDLQRYHQRLAELADPALVEWLHGGAGGPRID